MYMHWGGKDIPRCHPISLDNNRQTSLKNKKPSSLPGTRAISRVATHVAFRPTFAAIPGGPVRFIISHSQAESTVTRTGSHPPPALCSLQTINFLFIVILLFYLVRLYIMPQPQSSVFWVKTFKNIHPVFWLAAAPERQVQPSVPHVHS